MKSLQFVQNIIWIGSQTVNTADILDKIEEYLNGLDNIVLGDKPEGAEFCEEPKYGQLIIVINKMMGNYADEELQQELMEPEPGNNFYLINSKVNFR